MTKPIITEQELQAARDMLERMRGQCSPEHHATVVAMVELLTEVRALVSELDGDDDAPADETLLVLAIERARARRSRT